jgi:hypothetical protein
MSSFRSTETANLRDADLSHSHPAKLTHISGAINSGLGIKERNDFIEEEIEGHRKMSRDDCSFHKRDVVGKLCSVAFRYGDILCVTTPEIHSNSFAVDAVGLIAFEAWRALLTRSGRDDGHAVARFELRDAVGDFDDFAGGVHAEDMGQLRFHGIVAGADDAVERAVDRNRVDSYQYLARFRPRSEHILQA